MLKKRRNAKKMIRHTDVYYCVVAGRLDLDLYPLHLKADYPVFTHAHWFVPYPYYEKDVCVAKTYSLPWTRHGGTKVTP